MQQVFGRIQCRRLTVPSSELIPLKQYAAQEHITERGAIHRIRHRKVKAWKFGGRWFVHSPNTAVQ